MLETQNTSRYRHIAGALMRPAGRRTVAVATLALLVFIVCVGYRDAAGVAKVVRGHFEARTQTRQILSLRQYRSRLSQAAARGMSLAEFEASFGTVRLYEGTGRAPDGSAYTHACTDMQSGKRFRLRFEDGRLKSWRQYLCANDL